MTKQLKTIQSFEYQWRYLPEGAYLLSDEQWRQNVSGYILDELETTGEQLKGKRVLDVGCGNGRWSYGFEKLGCMVCGFDTSESGVQYARDHVAGRFDVANVLDVDSLLRLYPEHSFDVVWCWGVLHHTGDPERTFSNLARFVRENGVIHLYVYGTKSKVHGVLRFMFNPFNFKHRMVLARMLSKLNGASAHSNFDAFSPSLASWHTLEEVEGWFSKHGFSCWRVHPKWAFGSQDLFVTGRMQ